MYYFEDVFLKKFRKCPLFCVMEQEMSREKKMAEKLKIEKLGYSKNKKRRKFIGKRRAVR